MNYPFNLSTTNHTASSVQNRWIILITLNLFSTYLTIGQTLTLSAGPNYGRFYDFSKNEAQYRKEYSPEMGYRICATWSDSRLGSIFNLKFSAGIEEYGGKFYSSNGGLGGFTLENGSLKKQIVFIEFYPLNTELFPKLFLSTGAGCNVKLKQQLTGYRSQWAISSPPIPDLELSSINGFVTHFNFGLSATLTYEFNIGHLRIMPGYSYYLGLSREFRHLQSPAKSQRHCLQVGMGYSF